MNHNIIDKIAKLNHENVEKELMERLYVAEFEEDIRVFDIYKGPLGKQLIKIFWPNILKVYRECLSSTNSENKIVRPIIKATKILEEYDAKRDDNLLDKLHLNTVEISDGFFIIYLGYTMIKCRQLSNICA